MESDQLSEKKDFELESTNRIIQDKLCDFKVEKENNVAVPQVILIFSGKRKSGKDFITDQLNTELKNKSCIIRLSGPIKTHWAKSLNLDVNKLFGNESYKEEYRKQMAEWGEMIRADDYGYFCRNAVDMYNATNWPIWIVSDARRRTDLKWFLENYGTKCKFIRIQSSEEIRKSRGWKFTPGIDDSETECDLDAFDKWDLKITNDDENIESILQKLLLLLL